jgi:hypothetical protein
VLSLENRERGQRKKGGCSPSEGRRAAPVEDAEAWPETVDGGGGEDRRREGALAESLEGKEPLARSRTGGSFLKRDMGAPDSLQWLSGAHRTAHSSTGKRIFSARLPVHRTLHSAVSGARRTVR